MQDAVRFLQPIFYNKVLHNQLEKTTIAENHLFKRLDDVVHVVGLGHPNRCTALGVRQGRAVKIVINNKRKR